MQSGENLGATDNGRFTVLTTTMAGPPLFSSAGDFGDDPAAGIAKLVALGLSAPVPTEAYSCGGRSA